MEGKELLALKYIAERIDGNVDAEYRLEANYIDRHKEIGMYIIKFLEQGLIIAKANEWAIKGGSKYNKYNSNIMMIQYDLLRITQKAKDLIEYESRSKFGKLFYKIKNSIRKFVGDTIIETRKELIKFIVGLMALAAFLAGGYKLIEWISNINK